MTLCVNLIHDIAPSEGGGIYRMVVENPRGAEGKYELNKELGIVELDRILAAPMPFPFEYGFIPGTWSCFDDDPLDIMAIMPIATFPGCLLDVRVIGMFRMMDTGEEDNKILAVCKGDETFKQVHDLDEMPSMYLKKIEFFWENYKKLSPKKSTDGLGWSSRGVAEKYIEESIKCYREKFGTPA